MSWYVFGAQALVLRGLPRATADVDVTVLLGGRGTEDLVTALRRSGFALRFDAPAFVQTTRVLPVVHVASRLPVDVVLGGPGLEERFAERAEPVRVGRRSIPVATATHLVVMKVIAGRAKDLEDARALLASDDVDHSELNELTSLVAGALAEDDILHRLVELRRQLGARRPRVAPQPHTPGARKKRR